MRKGRERDWEKREKEKERERERERERGGEECEIVKEGETSVRDI